MTKLTNNENYKNLLRSIEDAHISSKSKIVSAINIEMLTSYWNIGRYIVEFEQKGKLKAEYGKQLLITLSKDLKLELGIGFSRTNLNYMRQFYSKYSIWETVSHKLSWSHYFELLKVDGDQARSFYMNQSILENWTVRELKRQKKTGLFHRLALNRDKTRIIELSRKGQIIESEVDLIKDPYVFEFLGIRENYEYTESDIEKSIINNLQKFLLELGKGFAYVGRQQRITLNNRHYFVDLVFYHTRLKCYILIDLKIGQIEYEHIGQMKLYLGYYEKEMNDEEDNQPIGIILTEEKDEIMVEYAMLNDSSKLVVSKYQLYLPDINDLKSRVSEIMKK